MYECWGTFQRMFLPQSAKLTFSAESSLGSSTKRLFINNCHFEVKTESGIIKTENWITEKHSFKEKNIYLKIT